MRKFFFVFCALCALVSCSGHIQKYDDALGTQVYTLDNGLKVYMSVNKQTPDIQTYIAVHVGSRNDPEETTGLAHYFEHLMFKGTPSFGTVNYEAEKPLLDSIEELFEVYRNTEEQSARDSIYNIIDSLSYEASKYAVPNEYDKLMGIIGSKGTNAWTYYDETVYKETIPSNRVDEWAMIQAERFRNPVLRGFHTELETIYEEFNMRQTRDGEKVQRAIMSVLFPNHPYGKHSVLGHRNHLKNPSVRNVRKYYEQYYVPNNIAICLSGDFNPKEMISVIEKYFGSWKPNPDIPATVSAPDVPLDSIVTVDVSGLEQERVALAWSICPANDTKNAAIASMASAMLYNGSAGLFDNCLNRSQKTMSSYAYAEMLADRGYFMVAGYPKQDQSLDEVTALILEQTARLAEGDFDESLLPATMNNIKLSMQQALEDNEDRATMYVNAFINDIPWEEEARSLEILESVTKDDIVQWAKANLRTDAYVRVNKLRGEDPSLVKIAAPDITPIVMNRDTSSLYLKQVQQAPFKPIEPVFADFSSLKQGEVCPNAQLLYSPNTLNDLFTLAIRVNRGSSDEPLLSLASDCLEYMDTPTCSADEFASKMYALACSFSLNVGETFSVIILSGLSENMEEAFNLVLDRLENGECSEKVLAELKSDVLKYRSDAKLRQRSCLYALSNYQTYGPESIVRSTVSNDQILSTTTSRMSGLIRSLLTLSEEISYYGPQDFEGVKILLAESLEGLGPFNQVDEHFPKSLLTPTSKVYLLQYDSPQLYYMQYSNDGRTFCPQSAPAQTLYGEYFSGSMSSIVFQEMRESRSLAYSASAGISSPSTIDGAYEYEAFIATQNDKLPLAVKTFDEIINDMPMSQSAFDVAKTAIEANLRTQRYDGRRLPGLYRSCQRLGLEEPMARTIFESLDTLTLESVKKYQQEWVAGRTYTYAILGDIKDLDMDFLKTLGPVEILTLEDVFGY